MAPLSVDAVRPNSAEVLPRADHEPAPERHPEHDDRLGSTPDPLRVSLQIANAIAAAVYGPRGEHR